MTLDYKEIGKRIARRRKELGLKQSEVEEKADLGYKYLSNIERSISIPSVEVIMRLASALDTTPDEFLIGTYSHENNEWKEEIQKKFPQYELTSAPLSLSVACHIGPGSLAITCTKKVSL